MKKLIALILLLCAMQSAKAQTLYFPPISGSTWDTINPGSLAWCPDKIDSLFNYLETNNTKAFIILKDGKIVIEQYFGQFTADSLWYWASAGKTVTGLLVGIAQEQGLLSIQDATSQYLGSGWTSCPPAKEALITIKDQICMTTGLDDAVTDPFCTLSSCLNYVADAGTRWAYHNAPYTLLDSVIIQASGMSFNNFFFSRLRNKTGMNGAFFPQGYNHVYFSNARSMARYGLLLLNRGKWDTTTVLQDTAYFTAMTNTANPYNFSYGYLTWLNGEQSFMIPQSQLVFNGFLMPDAPADLYAAMGKNGQIINVVPSENLVLIRMGNTPGTGIEDITPVFNNNIWIKLKAAFCNTAGIEEAGANTTEFSVSPDPATEKIRLKINLLEKENAILSIYNLAGKLIYQSRFSEEINIYSFKNGFYLIKINTFNKTLVRKFIKI